MAKQFHLSPFGKAIHCWVNKPDTKFSEGKPGTFKVDLVMDGPDAEAFRAKVQLEAEAAMERFWESDKGKKIPAGKRKEWTLQVPCADDEDEAGNPTGFVEAKFRQNSVIRYMDSQQGKLVSKNVKIGIKDTKDKLTSAVVFSGSELRVMYSFRDIVIESAKKVGTRLDFAQVQVRSLGTGSGPGGFGETEGDFVGADQDAADQENKASGEPSAAVDDGGDF